MTLSTNFQDPVGLSNGFPYSPMPIYSAPLPAAFSREAATPVSLPDWAKTPIFNVGRDTSFPIIVASRIPTPPLGRLIICTFPSIYKTRTTTGVLGQFYPPPAP